MEKICTTAKKKDYFFIYYFWIYSRLTCPLINIYIIFFFFHIDFFWIKVFWKKPLTLDENRTLAPRLEQSWLHQASQSRSCFHFQNTDNQQSTSFVDQEILQPCYQRKKVFSLNSIKKKKKSPTRLDRQSHLWINLSPPAFRKDSRITISCVSVTELYQDFRFPVKTVFSLRKKKKKKKKVRTSRKCVRLLARKMFGRLAHTHTHDPRKCPSWMQVIRDRPKVNHGFREDLVHPNFLTTRRPRKRMQSPAYKKNPKKGRD